MHFIVEGIGSIGQRHYKNLKQLGHHVTVLRSGQASSNRPFVQSFLDDQLAAGDPVKQVYSFDEAVALGPDGWIVATPNALHPHAATRVIQANIPVLIEKPIGAKREDLAALITIAQESTVPVLVGYNLRFHPLLQTVKRMVDDGDLGTLLAAHVEVGENIIDWHPWEDYKDTYAPYIKYGGGSLLCFSHDIDYLYWLLGTPDVVHAAGGKITPLAGDAEDLVQSLWYYKKLGVSATLHIDYWQRPKVRTLKIIGTQKTIIWDYYTTLKEFSHDTGEITEHQLPTDFERNTMFINEVAHFANVISGSEQSRIPLTDGIAVVEIVDAIKRALEETSKK